MRRSVCLVRFQTEIYLAKHFGAAGEHIFLGKILGHGDFRSGRKAWRNRERDAYFVSLTTATERKE